MLPEQFACVEYHGISGCTESSQKAILRLLQFGDIREAKIVTNENTHCFLLKNHIGDITFIKSGFSSGYEGTGPVSFSLILKLLLAHKVVIEEFEVHAKIVQKIDFNCLTEDDLENIEDSKPVRPSRWRNYVLGMHDENQSLWQHFHPFIPFSIINSKIIDLALSFWENPEDKIFTGYKRLEDLIRTKATATEHGVSLISSVFRGKAASLTWEIADKGEIEGRINLIIGAFMAHRNPKAHRVLNISPEIQVTQFLILNHLYELVSQSVRSAYPIVSE